ncbi:MAG: hypothetical protein H0T47_08625 [Planctomycetaceae bacterium]|nr:hypothetical protein [Planctomycetaceae bacterium]
MFLEGLLTRSTPDPMTTQDASDIAQLERQLEVRKRQAEAAERARIHDGNRGKFDSPGELRRKIAKAEAEYATKHAELLAEKEAALKALEESEYLQRKRAAFQATGEFEAFDRGGRNRINQLRMYLAEAVMRKNPGEKYPPTFVSDVINGRIDP